MVTFAEVETQAMELTESERATLAAHLLDSLPPVPEDEDEGLQEALLRRHEMETNPDSIITFEQLKNAVGR